MPHLALELREGLHAHGGRQDAERHVARERLQRHRADRDGGPGGGNVVHQRLRTRVHERLRVLHRRGGHTAGVVVRQVLDGRRRAAGRKEVRAAQHRRRGAVVPGAKVYDGAVRWVGCAAARRRPRRVVRVGGRASAAVGRAAAKRAAAEPRPSTTRGGGASAATRVEAVVERRRREVRDGAGHRVGVRRCWAVLFHHRVRNARRDVAARRRGCGRAAAHGRWLWATGARPSRGLRQGPAWAAARGGRGRLRGGRGGTGRRVW
ncbi:hypothetical protein STCU_11289 [Strigomonas culicis]|uniref:Uncharacterized protein n=1 Tax=Strigomonas culicis TaxID=28005 RepID=S9TJ56_9TRYP|nr:hypothetical protein STCU_11289 [Strigomonas culicis]|eukprot:EPY16418.1 hypothetical protein STCU_11289 [Strigomonas culicis]